MASLAPGPIAPEIVSRPVGEADMTRLADIVRRRGVKRIAYFHCDHFEPWRPVPGSRSFEENAEDVVRFADRCAANEFARRLTLFYKAQVPITRNPAFAEAERAGGGDLFGFVDRTPEQVAIFTGAIRALMTRVDHEFQVHVHHEHFTSNSGHRDPELVRIFADPGMAALDEARVEIALRRSLSAIRAETGLPLDRWFFVHGVWALNASDTSVCNVTNEIALLMRYGGRGDFTFPAGRLEVDPIATEPFFVRPFDAPRAYDLPGAQQERAWGNALAAKDKFFIWASPIRHLGSSIDYFSDWLAEKMADPVPFATEILEQCVVKDGTLWYKTHGHSMHTRYFSEDAKPVHPHDYPPFIRLLGTVFDAVTAAEGMVAFVTAAEAYDAFVGAPQIPDAERPLRAAMRVVAPEVVRDLKLRADRINRIATDFIAERMAGQEGEVAGIGSYYSKRAERGEALAGYEVRIAELLTTLPPLDCVYEVGSGLSLLTMLLASTGQHAVGIERDQSRLAVARDLFDVIGPSLELAPGKCDLWGTAAPAALSNVAGEKAALIFTNITSSIAADDLAELIRQAARFDVIVCDLSRFFIVRDEYEQNVLLAELVAAGWQNPSPITRTYWSFVRSEPVVVEDDHEDERAGGE